MKGIFKRVPISSLRRYSIRQEQESEEDLKALARSWLGRPVHPIVCRPDMTTGDGNRRLAGLMLLGETEVDVFVTEQNLTDAELLEIGVATAFHRKNLTGYEQWQAVVGIEAANPGLKQKDIAQKLQIDPGMITKILSVGKCSKAIQEALKEQKIPMTACHPLSLLPEGQQREELDKLLKGGTREGIAKPGKANGKPTPSDSEKTESVRILFSGATITLKAKDLSLATVAKLLLDASKEANIAMKDGTGVRTFERLMKDRAKKAVELKAAEEKAAQLKASQQEVATP